MSITTKLIDLISKPINISLLVATFLTSFILFLLNFLPLSLLEKLKINNVLNNYNHIIFIILISSFFLLIVQLTAIIYKKNEERKSHKFFRKTQNSLLKDEEALKILCYLYETHPQARELPYLNQKVKLLNQYGLIVQAVSQWMTTAHNPMMPYVLQPIAEEKLKKMKK